MVFVPLELKYSDLDLQHSEKISPLFIDCILPLGDSHFLPLDGANKVQKAKPGCSVLERTWSTMKACLDSMSNFFPPFCAMFCLICGYSSSRMTLYKSIEFGKQLHLMTICSFWKNRGTNVACIWAAKWTDFSSALYSHREGLLLVSELWENGLTGIQYYLPLIRGPCKQL